jgi:hypothetical protein
MTGPNKPPCSWDPHADPSIGTPISSGIAFDAHAGASAMISVNELSCARSVRIGHTLRPKSGLVARRPAGDIEWPDVGCGDA